VFEPAAADADARKRGWRHVDNLLPLNAAPPVHARVYRHLAARVAVESREHRRF
jgi:hypothetical protein